MLALSYRKTYPFLVLAPLKLKKTFWGLPQKVTDRIIFPLLFLIRPLKTIKIYSSATTLTFLVNPYNVVF